ncbi:major facilitator superfamily MFS_1 [Methanobacterium lacus]|uniref:Major facilitator superfamily MFS_1 n=1 Tax=Methanobacterium lacus (strain AL-21) TaxID=877455 RepID=F0T688_METLA|nr:MFS transporter [Methanobacterium lacus]ADZ09403.1 major facilitator superfamily MFS_1 [Methanobacterium lacus]
MNNNYAEKYQINRIMAGLMVGLLIAAFDYSIMSTAMPNIINSLNGIEFYVWPFSAYMLTSTISIIIFGKMSDIYGRKSILVAGIIIFIITSIMCGFSENMIKLIIFRGLQGIGGGILISLPFVMVGEIFSQNERAKYMGILGSVFGIADVLGPILGGVVTDTLGWRYVFFINVPLGIIALILIYNSIPNFIHDHVKKVIDYRGIILFTLGLSSMFLGLTFTGQVTKHPPALIVGLMLMSILMFITFVLVENNADEPIIPLHLFKNSIFNVSSIESFLASAIMFSGIIYIPLFTQGVLGMNAVNSGFIMIPMLLSLTVSSVVTGQIISKTGKYKSLVIIEFLITILGVALLASMDEYIPYYMLILYSTILGIGSGMAYNIFNVAVQNTFSIAEIGIVTASMRFFRNIGTIVFVPVFGFIMNFSLNASTIGSNTTQTLIVAIQNIFYLTLILALLGLIISLFLKETHLCESSSDKTDDDLKYDKTI